MSIVKQTIFDVVGFFDFVGFIAAVTQMPNSAYRVQNRFKPCLGYNHNIVHMF